MNKLINVARSLAQAHQKNDPKTTTIKLFPARGRKEIRLVEVSGGAPTTGEVIPFRFGSDPSNGIDYPSVVILLSEAEWQDVTRGALPLPQGWDLRTAVDLQ